MIHNARWRHNTMEVRNNTTVITHTGQTKGETQKSQKESACCSGREGEQVWTRGEVFFFSNVCAEATPNYHNYFETQSTGTQSG